MTHTLQVELTVGYSRTGPLMAEDGTGQSGGHRAAGSSLHRFRQEAMLKTTPQPRVSARIPIVSLRGLQLTGADSTYENDARGRMVPDIQSACLWGAHIEAFDASTEE